MSNIGKFEYSAFNLVAATSLLADQVCHTECTSDEAKAQLLWIASRVRDDMQAFYENLMKEIEQWPAGGARCGN